MHRLDRGLNSLYCFIRLGKDSLLKQLPQTSGSVSVNADRTARQSSIVEDHKAQPRRGLRQVAATFVGSVLVAPLLLLNASPGRTQAEAETNSYRSNGQATMAYAADLPGRAIGTLSGEEVDPPLFLSTLSNGAELRSLAVEARLEAARQEAELAAAEAQKALETTTTTAPPPPPPPPTTTTAPPPPPPAPAPGGPSEAAWAALRNCESGGNYGAVNPSGLYRGAYQFHQATWDAVARGAGRGDLVGMHPDQADPASQDQLARALYAQRGASPWPVCGRHLR